VAIGVVIAYAISRVPWQIVHPYLEHDDWNALVHRGAPMVRDPLKVLLYQGRGLNYAWWRLVGQYLDPVIVSVLFQLGYLAFVVWLAVRLSRSWWPVLVVPLLFVSPMVSQISYWPATLAPSLLVLGASVWALPLTRERRSATAVWLLVFTMAAVFTYPPVALLVFLALMVDRVHREIGSLAVDAVIFVGCYVVSVLTVFALNWRLFGHFGVKLQAWRNPNKLRSLSDLVQNLGTYARDWHDVMAQAGYAVVAGLICLAICLVVGSLRHRAVVLALSILVVAGLEAATTLVEGVGTPFRGRLWIWVAAAVAITWAVAGTRRQLRALGAAALVVAVSSGAVYWSSMVSNHEQRLPVIESAVARIVHVADRHPGASVVVYGTQQDWTRRAYKQTAWLLGKRAWYAGAVKVRRCHPKVCERIGSDALAAHVGETVFAFHDRVVVVPPRQLTGSAASDAGIPQTWLTGF
jgi:hypothetical protein